MNPWAYCGGQILIWLCYLGGPAFVFIGAALFVKDDFDSVPILTIAVVMEVLSHLISAGVIK
jgi:hypothetical protein